MIIKQYELKKKISPKDKFFLLYGENKGLIEETIKLSLKPILPKKVFNYEEKDVIENFENFKENILNKSFFENEKVFVISRVTDKIFKYIEIFIIFYHVYIFRILNFKYVSFFIKYLNIVVIIL